MGVTSTFLKGNIPCRIARISFSGELAFEVYVKSDFANTMMDLLWENAKKYDGCLYGLEALGALRVEKGHVTAAELDGRVTIDDAGLSVAWNRKYVYSICSSIRLSISYDNIINVCICCSYSKFSY